MSKFFKILGKNYKCKDMFISLEREEVDNNLKEKYAEIDMYNIRYLYSKKDIVCNLIRQNIQDISIINRLHDYFVMLDTDNVSFIISISVIIAMRKIRFIVAGRRNNRLVCNHPGLCSIAPA